MLLLRLLLIILLLLRRGAPLRMFSSYPEHELLQLPALSPTMESGVIARWNKKEGEFISAGDIIAEVETDKATVDYEATDDAYLAKIIYGEGSGDLKVGTVIGVTVEDESEVAAFADFTVSADVESSSADAAPAAPAVSSPPSTPPAVSVPAPPPSPPPPPPPSASVSTGSFDPRFRAATAASALGPFLAAQQQQYLEHFGETGTDPIH